MDAPRRERCVGGCQRCGGDSCCARHPWEEWVVRPRSGSALSAVCGWCAQGVCDSRMLDRRGRGGRWWRSAHGVLLRFRCLSTDEHSACVLINETQAKCSSVDKADSDHRLRATHVPFSCRPSGCAHHRLPAHRDAQRARHSHTNALPQPAPPPPLAARRRIVRAAAFDRRLLSPTDKCSPNRAKRYTLTGRRQNSGKQPFTSWRTMQGERKRK